MEQSLYTVVQRNNLIVDCQSFSSLFALCEEQSKKSQGRETLVEVIVLAAAGNVAIHVPT